MGWGGVIGYSIWQLIDRHSRVFNKIANTPWIFPSHDPLSNGQFPREQAILSHHGGLHRKNVHVFGMIHHSANNLCPTEDFRSPGLYRKTRLLKFVHTPNICREIESHIGKDERPRRSLSRLWGVGWGRGWQLILVWAIIGLGFEYFLLRQVGRLPNNLTKKRLIGLPVFPLFSHY